MATAILKEIFYVEVIRTRESAVLGEMDLIYDVGDGEFDHHQMEKEYRQNGTPYAACGLIWRKFGREAVEFMEPSLKQEEVDSVFYYVDSSLIQGIDAADNGIRTYEAIVPTVCISSIIAGFNPTWYNNVSENDAFNEAVTFASSVLRNTINQKIATLKARSYVMEAYNNRARPELLVLDRAYQWEHTLYEIDTEGEVLFVIYPRGEEYLLQTIRTNDGKRRNRKSLPQSWAGKRDGELGRIIGIDDAVFCHASRFIAAAKSLESVLKMADLAIREPDDIVQYGFLRTLKRLLSKKRLVIRW